MPSLCGPRIPGHTEDCLFHALAFGVWSGSPPQSSRSQKLQTQGTVRQYRCLILTEARAVERGGAGSDCWRMRSLAAVGTSTIRAVHLQPPQHDLCNLHLTIHRKSHKDRYSTASHQ